MQLNMDRLRSQLILEEGMKLVAYDDATGMPPGRNSAPRGKLTIGVGRNLDDNPLTTEEEAAIGHDGRSLPITHDQAILLLNNDICKACDDLDSTISWWRYLAEIRARVLVDLCFNMGALGVMRFKNFLSNLRAGNYATAADDLQDSVWYNQVRTRGVRLVAMVRSGKDWTT